MKHVYLDASALVKRFRFELGSEAVNDTIERVSTHHPRRLVVPTLTTLETLSIPSVGEVYMANFNKRIPENVPGEFFVDSTCIDCDTCRQLAPATFGETSAYAFVHTQPQTTEATRQALRALLTCPTGSIGTVHHHNTHEVRTDFPLRLDEGVYYCGFNSPKSYGGNSYFVQHADGNWLIDAPKFLPYLVRQFEAMGGLARIFLTHRDDVADAAKYARALRGPAHHPPC